jgi:hypothetical protein
MNTFGYVASGERTERKKAAGSKIAAAGKERSTSHLTPTESAASST